MKQSKITIIAMMFAILYSIGLIWQAGIQPPEKAEELQVPQLGYAQRIPITETAAITSAVCILIMSTTKPCGNG